MIKTIVSVLIASIVVVIFNTWLQPFLAWIYQGYQSVVHLLQFVFATNATAKQITHIIPLFIIPVVIMGIVSLLYFAIRRRRFPWMVELLWATWLILAILVIYHY